MGGWFVDIFIGYLISLLKMVARERKAPKLGGFAEASSARTCQFNLTYLPKVGQAAPSPTCPLW
jgi:hypothetical protein